MIASSAIPVFPSPCPDHVMRFAFLLVLLLASYSSSQAQSIVMPATILAAADSAVEQFRTVIYDAHRRGISGDGSPYDVAARVHLSRLPDSNDVGFKVRIETSKMILAYDGERSLLIQPQKKLVWQIDSIATFAQNLDGRVEGGLVNMLFRRAPFGGMVPNARYDGTGSVNGVQCHRITVRTPDNDLLTDQIAEYYFGVADHVLRMRQAAAKYSGNSASDTLTISDMRLNVPIADSMFAVKIPAGYTFEILARNYTQPVLGVGSKAPEWTLPDTTGASLSLADLKGRIVVLDFWYIGCPPCVRSMPKLAKLHERFSRQGVVFMGINTTDEPAKALEFVRRKGFNYSFAFNGRSVADAYKVSAFPTMFVVGKDGTINFVHEGDGDDLEKVLEEAIEKEMARK